jgi:hypothetical protein
LETLLGATLGGLLLLLRLDLCDCGRSRQSSAPPVYP